MNPEMDWQQLNALGFQPMQQPDQNMSAMTPEQAALIEQRMKERNAKKMSMASGPTSLPFQPNRQVASMSVGTQFQTPEDRAYQADTKAKWKEYLLNANQQLENQKQTIDETKKIQPAYDWTAAAGLADFLSGGQSNLSQTAKNMKGISQEEKLGMLAKLQDQMSQRQENLANITGARMNSNDALKAQMKMAEALDKNQRFGMAQDRQLGMKFNQDLRNDVKHFQEISPSFSKVEAALAPDANGNVNAQRVKMALSDAARMMGEKGVLTDNDILRVQAKTLEGVAADVANFVTGPDATIPASYVGQLANAIQAGKQAVTDAAQKNVSRTKDTYTALGLSPDLANQVADTIYGNYLKGPEKQEQPKVDPIQELLKNMPKGK